MSKSIILILLTVIMQLLCTNSEVLKQTDESLCLTIDILCVKDVILKIAKTSKTIHTAANGIELSMRRKERNEHSLQQNINRVRKRIQSYSGFPISKSHDQFEEINNIVRNDLVRLMIEEHDAVTYLYYSIKNLLRESFFDHEYDDLFNNILQHLQHNMLCNYRNILRVYSETWQPNNSTNSIQFMQIRKRDISSFDYRTYAIIILESLRQWMERITDVLHNLENKLI